MTEEIKTTRRHLPHWTMEGSTYFITFRLEKGTLNSAEVRLVLDHLKSGDPEFYDLLAAVVMPDHVHLVLRPREGVELSRITKGIKGVAARKVNLARGSRGSIWHNESFDRIVRDQEDWEEKLEYILNNPVKAELAEDGFDYPGMYVKG